MPNLTSVTVTAGVPTAGTGTVSTIDNLVGTAGTASANVLSVQGVASGTTLPVTASLAAAQTLATVTTLGTITNVVHVDDNSGSLTVDNNGTFAVQAAQSGTWNVSNVSGTVSLPTGAATSANQPAVYTEDAAAAADPTGNVLIAVRRDTLSTSEVSTDGDNIALKATNKGKLHVASEVRFGDTVSDLGSGTGGSATQRVILDSGQLGTLGQTTKANSVPVVPASDWVYNTGKYVAVAASQTDSVIQASAGAAGDYLDHVVVIPATTAPGVVTIKDNATAIISYPGGGTTALLTLTPFTIYVGAVSSSGAWKITTGANVSVLAVGRFS